MKLFIMKYRLNYYFEYHYKSSNMNDRLHKYPIYELFYNMFYNIFYQIKLNDFPILWCIVNNRNDNKYYNCRFTYIFNNNNIIIDIDDQQDELIIIITTGISNHKLIYNQYDYYKIYNQLKLLEVL